MSFQWTIHFQDWHSDMSIELNEESKKDSEKIFDFDSFEINLSEYNWINKWTICLLSWKKVEIDIHTSIDTEKLWLLLRVKF